MSTHRSNQLTLEPLLIGAFAVGLLVTVASHLPRLREPFSSLSTALGR